MSSGARIGSKKIKTYVLDTSAVLTFLNEEPGVELVDEIIGDKNNRLFISFLTLYEIYYVNFRRRSKGVAELLLRSTLQLGFDIVYDNSLNDIISAGAVKGTFRMSAVDAWIASLAIREQAILVHKDPEFELLGDQLQLLNLPYTQTTN